MKTNALTLSCLGLALFACSTERHSSAPASAGSAATSAIADPVHDDSALPDDAGELAADRELVELTAPPGPEPVRWRACGHVGGRDVSCAEVYVPLDHADPEGEQIAISINRVAANRAYPRRGLLLFNPGGPGGSGKSGAVDFIREFDVVAPGYDIIGFDPRGILDSGDRACAPALSEALPYGQKQAGVTSKVPELAEVLAEAARCADSWGPLFHRLGSNQVVRDIDWLRQALGEAKLNFLGVSYGTRLGALYAHYFPETTGAIALDAVVTPTLDWLQDARDTFDEQTRLTDRLFTDCESGARPTCPTNARQLFTQLLAAATELGLFDTLMGAWINGISSAAGHDELVGLLQIQNELGSEWLREVQPGPELERSWMPLAAVNCIDATTEAPTVEQLEALYAEFEAKNPPFSGAIASAVMCAGWPVVRDPVPLPVATDAPSLLVVGGRNDWRTPYAGAVAMTEALGNARLLTSNHIGHGALVLGSDCTRSAMRNFFVDGVLPPEGTVCDSSTPPPEAPTPGLLPSSLLSARPGLLPR